MRVRVEAWSIAVLGVVLVVLMGVMVWVEPSAPKPVTEIEDPSGMGGFSTLYFPYYADPKVDEANFARILELYREQILSVSAARARMDAESYVRQAREQQAWGASLGTREAEKLMQKLLKIREDSEVWSEDAAEFAYQRVPLVRAASAASAAALMKLRDQKVDHPHCVVLRLGAIPEAIDPAWREYLEAVETQMEGTDAARAAGVLLCRMGDPVRRMALLEKAKKDLATAEEVEALLMSRSAVSGERKFAATPEDMELARFLAEKSTSSMVRVKCASYLANTGERALAEAACLEVLQERYAPVGVPPERAEVDRSLGIAKDWALDALYYDIQTERGLRAIYEMAQERDRRTQILMNTPATEDIDEKYGSPGQTNLDSSKAQSLLSGLRGL